MTAGSAVASFEDARWRRGDQPVEWRHRAALELVAAEPVLDVGAGDGLFPEMLRDARGIRDVLVLDISPVAVDRARRRGVRAQLGDLGAPLPFADGAFGTACALEVLEHLYDPVRTLRELARVARTVVVVVPNFHYWRDRLRMVTGRVPFQCKPQRGHVHWFNPAILHGHLDAAGLRAEVTVVGGPGVLGVLGDRLARRRPALFAHSIGVRAVPR